MLFAMKIFMIIVLLMIAIQDFRTREIYWWLFPILGALIITDAILRISFQSVLREAFYNFIFLASQGSLLVTWCLVSGKSPSGIKDSIGLGDILFLLIMVFGFSSINFILIYVAGLIFSLTVWIAAAFMLKPKTNTIPLAGLLSIFTCIILVAENFHTGINRFCNLIIT